MCDINPEEVKSKAVDEIFIESKQSLMAHTIRGVVNHFHKNLVSLDVIVSRDLANAVYRHAPSKASILKTTYIPKDPKSPYYRVRARIFIRKDANHHLSRLCIAHELFHLLMALEHFKGSNREKWDGQWKKEDESACNGFAQELCGKHNEFNSDSRERDLRVLFPSELFAQGFVLDLSDVNLLPDCLKIKH